MGCRQRLAMPFIDGCGRFCRARTPTRIMRASVAVTAAPLSKSFARRRRTCQIISSRQRTETFGLNSDVPTSVVQAFRACETIASHVVQTFRSARHGRPEGLHYDDFFTPLRGK